MEKEGILKNTDMVKFIKTKPKSFNIEKTKNNKVLFMFVIQEKRCVIVLSWWLARYRVQIKDTVSALRNDK